MVSVLHKIVSPYPVGYPSDDGAKRETSPVFEWMNASLPAPVFLIHSQENQSSSPDHREVRRTLQLRSPREDDYYCYSTPEIVGKIHSSSYAPSIIFHDPGFS
ncbi:hypothetical protein D3C75_874670 [compost metagenome]